MLEREKRAYRARGRALGMAEWLRQFAREIEQMFGLESAYPWKKWEQTRTDTSADTDTNIEANISLFEDLHKHYRKIHGIEERDNVDCYVISGAPPKSEPPTVALFLAINTLEEARKSMEKKHPKLSMMKTKERETVMEMVTEQMIINLRDSNLGKIKPKKWMKALGDWRGVKKRGPGRPPKGTEEKSSEQIIFELFDGEKITGLSSAKNIKRRINECLQK